MDETDAHLPGGAPTAPGLPLSGGKHGRNAAWWRNRLAPAKPNAEGWVARSNQQPPRAESVLEAEYAEAASAQTL